MRGVVVSRCLGIDYGSRRMGLALSDETAAIATPWDTIEVTGPRQASRAIAEVCAARGISRIVIGLPLDMQGHAGPAAQAVLHFVEYLRVATGLPVITWDERLSTRMAERCLIDANVRRNRRKQVRDRMAAQIILQSFLDAQTMPDADI